MHPVLGLLELDAGRRLEDLVGDFHGLEPEALVDLAADLGFEVSQASVSRDIAALGLVKIEGRWTAAPASSG